MSTSEDRAILNSVFNPLLPLGESPFEDILPNNLTDEELCTPEVEQIQQLEIEAVRTAESGDVDKAISILDKVVQLAPQRPSGYNNRAQAMRLQGNISGAFEDLNNSINLSQGRGRSGCLALCQRGIIYRLQGEDEKAAEDFKKAAALGSDFAKAQLVQMNPYAAMCNQMLSKVFSQYQCGLAE